LFYIWRVQLHNNWKQKCYYHCKKRRQMKYILNATTDFFLNCKYLFYFVHFWDEFNSYNLLMHIYIAFCTSFCVNLISINGSQHNNLRNVTTAEILNFIITLPKLNSIQTLSLKNYLQIYFLITIISHLESESVHSF